MPKRTLDVHFSADCNMRCQYCYLHNKIDEPREHNKLIRTALLDGSFLENITNALPPTENPLIHIGLWGAEPTLNLDIAKTFLVGLFDAYPTTTRFGFSTNSYLGIDRVGLAADILMEYNKSHPGRKPIDFMLQFSLDGPEWLNDRSRKTGATQHTIDTILAYVAKYKDASHLLTAITIKPTMTCDDLNDLMNSPGGTLSWFRFFDDLYEQTAMRLGSGKQVRLHMNPTPGLINPGNFTMEDGKAYAKFLAECRAIDTANLRHYSGILSAQGIGLLRKVYHRGRIPMIIRHGDLACGAGNGIIVVNHKGDLFTCHRLVGYTTNGGGEEILRCHGVQGSHNRKLEETRLNYINSAYHAYHRSRRAMWEIMLTTLASAGQCDPRALTDPEYKELLYLATYDMRCHVGAQDDATGSMYIPAASEIKLMGNGALDELLKGLEA